MAKRSSIATIVNGWIDGGRLRSFPAIACPIHSECVSCTGPDGNTVNEID